MTVALLQSTALLAGDRVKLSGFGTVGLSVESEDDLAFLRDSNQSKDPDKDASFAADSIIGLQASSRFLNDWRATTQLVYRDRPKQDFGQALELAFLGYNPIPNLDIRAGRFAVDMFQLSDFRRVDYANLWVRPPTEVYAWILPSYIDGGDIAYSFINGPYFWRIKLQYGDTEPYLDFPDGSQRIKTEFNDYLVATLTLDFDNWRARVSYSQSNTAASTPGFVAGLAQVNAFVPGPVGDEAGALYDLFLRASDREVRYSQASLSYDDGDWIIDTELTRLSTSGALVPTGLAGFISVGHRFDTLTPYAIYSRFASDQNLYESSVDWSASGFEALRDAAISTINGVQIGQHTHSLGLRWDARPKIAIKAQWDRSYIDRKKFAIWAHRNERANEEATVDLFSVSLNFLF